MSMSHLFRFHSTDISKFLKEAFNFILRIWHHLFIWDTRLTREKLTLYSRLIAEANSPLPNYVNYLDGTLRPMCRPSTNQRIDFSDHKWQHGIKFQGVRMPDGLLFHLSGPYSASTHDSKVLKKSGLIPFLRTELRTNSIQHSLYADVAYPIFRRLTDSIEMGNSY